MSLTQTYYIAASARSKLAKEASRPDHDLRLLVGHANLLDCLMIELQDAERQQEQWFNQTMAKASKPVDRHIQWASTVSIEEDDDDVVSDSDSESENEDDFDMIAIPRRIVQAPVQISTRELDEEEDDDDDEFYDDMEDDTDLTLTRVASQLQSPSPPDLVFEEESDDESPPTSPPTSTFDLSDKESLLTTTFYGAKSQPQYLEDDHPLFIDTTAPLISSY